MEGFVTRYDNTFYTYSTSYRVDVTGIQTLFETYIAPVRTQNYEDGYNYKTHRGTRSVGERLLSETVSKVFEVPAGFEPAVELLLQTVGR